MACLPRKFFADIHPKFRTPWKNTILVGFLAAIVGSVTPIDDIGKMVNIGTLLAFVIVCASIIVLRRTDPGAIAAFPHAVGSAGSHHGRSVQWLHDGEVGLGELGAIDYLAGDWDGCVLHLQREEQPGASRAKRSCDGEAVAESR